MKLATRDDGTRDGELIVVSRDNKTGVAITAIAPTMQALMDDWATLSPKADAIYAALNAGTQDGAFAIDESKLRSPLPRA